MKTTMDCIIEEYGLEVLTLGDDSPCDLVDCQGLLLLAKGQKITPSIKAMLVQKQLFVIWRTGDEINWLYSDAQLICPRRLQEATGFIQQAIQSIRSDSKLDGYFKRLRNYDSYTFLHSLNVALLSVLLGLELQYSQEKLEQLTLGALLHDIGKLMISTAIVNKAGRLTMEEYECVKKHPGFGCELVGERISPEARAILLQHQERWNGQGYPTALQQGEIHPLAQIVAVADVFDAVISNRPYRKGLPPGHGLEIVINGRDVDFSPEIVDAFSQVITIYPENSLVTLNTGETGIVTEIPIRHPTRPKVEIVFDAKGNLVKGKCSLDLLQEENCYIAAIHCERDTHMNMMLIDDDKDCILGLAGALEPTGHSCEMFTVPERAVELYDGKRYDVVITDMRMPGMSGIEVLKAIRSQNPEARVIIITGYGDVEAAISAVNFGAYAFFGKPINVEELIETIEKIGMEVEQEKRNKLGQDELAIEYGKLKIAYQEMQTVLKKRDSQES